jgi:signal transduction histidine kinase
MNENNIMPIFLAGTLLLTLFAFFLIAFLLVQKQKQNKFRLEKQRMEFEKANELLRTRLEVQESTINQVAMELHDHIVQFLSLVKFKIHATAICRDEAQRADLCEETVELQERVINELRAMSHSLNTDFIKQTGLVTAVTNELENVLAARGLKGGFSIKGNYQPFDAQTELVIFRIVQEALHNVVKHARARVVEVLVDNMPGAFRLQIRDDGVGFDAQDPALKKGVGFINMQQRAGFIKGSIDVSSSPGAGTTLSLLINNSNGNN